jgi:hypothetical protein
MSSADKETSFHFVCLSPKKQVVVRRKSAEKATASEMELEVIDRLQLKQSGACLRFFADAKKASPLEGFDEVPETSPSKPIYFEIGMLFRDYVMF